MTPWDLVVWAIAVAVSLAIVSVGISVPCFLIYAVREQRGGLVPPRNPGGEFASFDDDGVLRIPLDALPDGIQKVQIYQVSDGMKRAAWIDLEKMEPDFEGEEGKWRTRRDA